MDSKRKGQLLPCDSCRRKTKHIAITDRKEKLVWWICECGDSKLQDNWS